MTTSAGHRARDRRRRLDRQRDLPPGGSLPPGRLLLLDRDETLLHDVASGALATGAETILLDLCDRERTAALLQDARPEVVFHAAAHKHVPILERHPAQAATTNVLSTWWLAQAAAENGCERFVHLSTDKAAHPCSVMGATKRAAEHVVVGVGRRYDLPCAAVRFGVLGSRGSVADVPPPDPRRWAGHGHERGDDATS